MIDVWAAKRKNRDLRNEELQRKVPTGWSEGETDSAWKLPRWKKYTFAVGGYAGPSLAVKTVCERHSPQRDDPDDRQTLVLAHPG
jgi:hypothetical protein